jgi:tetratricopeptide (TPR) repeat protein
VRLRLVALLLLVTAPLNARGQGHVIDVRNVRSGPTSFEALWSAHVKALRAGETADAERTFQEIRRLRIERNVRSLEEVALALVSQGQERLGKGERDRAEADFRKAIALDPHLPDAHFGLSASELKKGPLGILPALKSALSGTFARMPTSRGRFNLFRLLVPLGLLVLLATATAVAVALLIRQGPLLLHDLEESLGAGRSRTAALALYAILLFLPTMTFQGYGWLPLWWLALLFVYLSWTERAVALVIVLAGLAVGPLVHTLENRALTEQNALYQAATLAIEGGADTRSIAQLEAAVRQHPEDRDLVYLLAVHHKKAGRYDDAASLYREVLRDAPKDPIALNNLANVEFARGEFKPAIARYKLVTENASSPQHGATAYYNMSVAHLQLFEYQPAQEARSQAERLAAGLIGSYDDLWKYDKGDYAVVDLCLDHEQVRVKFAGSREGVVEKNVSERRLPPPDVMGLAAATFNRFAGFVGIGALVGLALAGWRGKKMFTMRCYKCGTPFCRRCHLGAATFGLCTQCHHLFIVRDGVSGPARNRKLLEVQKEEVRRDRIYRALSLAAPGTGHVYARRILLGFVLLVVWSSVLGTVVLAGRVLPMTEAPANLAKPWGLAVAAVVLVATYAFANRGRPEFEVFVPFRRASAPRARAS